MKKISLFSGMLLASMLAGCASKPLYLSTVGPNPAGISSTSNYGNLEVFSATHVCRDGNEFDINPQWTQHTDYSIYTVGGQRIRRVSNSTGKYEETPAMVSLPAGKYIVRAEGKDYYDVKVPVAIKPGRTTKVHLDDAWNPPTHLPAVNIVKTPSGNPVGWRSN